MGIFLSDTIKDTSDSIIRIYHLGGQLLDHSPKSNGHGRTKNYFLYY